MLAGHLGRHFVVLSYQSINDIRLIWHLMSDHRKQICINGPAPSVTDASR